jgi:hypothetical protein
MHICNIHKYGPLLYWMLPLNGTSNATSNAWTGLPMWPFCPDAYSSVLFVLTYLDYSDFATTQIVVYVNNPFNSRTGVAFV